MVIVLISTVPRASMKMLLPPPPPCSVLPAACITRPVPEVGLAYMVTAPKGLEELPILPFISISPADLIIRVGLAAVVVISPFIVTKLGYGAVLPILIPSLDTMLENSKAPAVPTELMMIGPVPTAMPIVPAE